MQRRLRVVLHAAAPAFSSRASESGLPGLCEMDRVPARPDVVLECRFEGVRTAPDASPDCRRAEGDMAPCRRRPRLRQAKSF
jgi:hypothetical protein